MQAHCETQIMQCMSYEGFTCTLQNALKIVSDGIE